MDRWEYDGICMNRILATDWYIHMEISGKYISEIGIWSSQYLVQAKLCPTMVDFSGLPCCVFWAYTIQPTTHDGSVCMVD